MDVARAASKMSHVPISEPLQHGAHAIAQPGYGGAPPMVQPVYTQPQYAQPQFSIRGMDVAPLPEAPHPPNAASAAPPVPLPKRKNKAAFVSPLIASYGPPSPLEGIEGPLDLCALWTQEEEARIAKLEVKLETSSAAGSSLVRSRRTSYETYSGRKHSEPPRSFCMPAATAMEPIHEGSACLPPSNLCLVRSGCNAAPLQSQRIACSGCSSHEDMSSSSSSSSSARSSSASSSSSSSSPFFADPSTGAIGVTGAGLSLQRATFTPARDMTTTSAASVQHQPRPRSASLDSFGHGSSSIEPVMGATSAGAPRPRSSPRNPHGLTMSQRVAALQIGRYQAGNL